MQGQSRDNPGNPGPVPWIRKVAEQKFPNFRPEFLSRILLRIFPELFEGFSCFVSWEMETSKKSPKIPGVFQCEIPRQTRRTKIHKSFLESGPSNSPMRFLLTSFLVYCLFSQGPPNGGVPNGGFPDLDLSFLSCPFGTFPIFP